MKKVIILFLGIMIISMGTSYAHIEELAGYPKNIIINTSGDSVETLRGALDVHEKDVHWEGFIVNFRKDSVTTSAITSPVTKDSSYITVADSTKFPANSYVVISEGSTRETDVVKVITSAGAPTHVLTFAKPMEHAYTTSGIVTLTDINMANGSGSIASPVIYSLSPPLNEVWHIDTIYFALLDNVSPSLELFGGITALTNGLVMRIEGSRTRNLMIMRNNIDLREILGGTEVDIQQKSGGGDYLISGIWHLKEHSDSIIRLDGALGDSVKIYVQDNLTSQINISIKAMGHVEGE